MSVYTLKELTLFIRKLKDVEKTTNFVNWGAGTSHRLVVDEDGLGFTVCHTIVWPGTQSLLEYKNHLEACYCIEGYGEVEEMDGNCHIIEPGTIYVLDRHDKHILRNVSEKPLTLVSVFNPALIGHEVHTLKEDHASSY